MNNYRQQQSRLTAAQICLQLDEWRQQRFDGIINSNVGQNTLSICDEIELIEQVVQRLFVQPRFVNLLMISSRSDAEQYQIVNDFLSPYGQLWKIIFHLDSEPNLKFGDGSTNRRRTDIASSEKSNKSCSEYYLERFAHHLLLVAPYIQSCPLTDDSVYLRLLADYTSFLLPIGRSFPAAQLLSSPPLSTGSIVDESTSDYRIISAPLGLFRSNARRHHAASSLLASNSNSNNSVVNKTWTFVAVLVDVWTRTIDTQQCPPTLVHLTALRYLIKQVHTFLESIGNESLIELKRSMLVSLVRTPLYNFLLHNFNHWPLDASFSHVLELWFTYIRPWRYADVDDVRRPSIDIINRYSDFIDAHQQFYTVLLIKAIDRFMKLDFMSIKNIDLLEEFVRVFTQPNIQQIIDYICDSNLSQANFRSEINDRIVRLVDFVSRSRDRLDQRLQIQIDECNQQLSSSWLPLWIVSLMSTKNEHIEMNRRAIGRLETICNAFCTAFNVTSSTTIPENIGDMSSFIDASIDRNRIPDHFVDKTTGLMRLTPIGRNQVLNNNRRFNFTGVNRLTPRRLAPIVDWEWTALARLLHRASIRLNNTAPIRSLSRAYRSSSNSWRTRVAHCLLDAPSPDVRQFGKYPAVSDVIPRIEPGIHLRRFADIRIELMLLLLVVALSYALDWSWIASLFTIIIVAPLIAIVLFVFVIRI